MEDALQLGGNIELTGFRDIDRSSFVIVKKIVGNYARKFSDNCASFEGLQLHLKSLNESGSKFELHGKLSEKGGTLVAKETDFNLFFVLDRTLKKLESQLK